jgi:glycosyltransferase involved in cell wall biosynthesis
MGTKTPRNIQDTERHVVHLAGTQRARGMDSAVVTSKNGLFFTSCEKDGIPAFVVDDLLASGEVAPEPDVSAQGMVAALKDLDPEIIHCHDLSMIQAAVMAASIFQVPCVVALQEGEAGRIIHEIITARRAGREFIVITASKREFSLMEKDGMAGIDVHYVPYGTPGPSGAHQPEQTTSCRPNLMTMADLEFVKGIDLAILAMVELRRRRGSDCPVLNIYGAGDAGETLMDKVFGDLGPYLIEMATVLGLDNVVKFHGIQADVLDKCSSSDVLIVPSRFERGSLVVLEAMSRGMPIVACDVGQVAEMLPDRRYGRIVPVNSITALADAIESMLVDIASGQFDPDLLVKRHQSQYSIEKMADRITNVYQSALLAR